MTDNGSGAAKIELDVLTTFQEYLHVHEDPEEHIPSKFNYTFIKTTWSVNLIEEMDATVKSDGKVITYTTSNKYDFLLYSYLTQKISPMKLRKSVRKKVQICLPHNLGHNIIVRGDLVADGTVIQTIDSTWLDIHSQFFMEPGFRDNHNMAIGNVPFLEEWATHIPGYEITIHQPFFYSKHTAVALPLFLGSLGRVTHQYEFRRELSQILRMRILEDEETNKWKEIPYNWNYMAAVSNDEKFDQPSMYGKYAIITDAERYWHKGLVLVDDKSKNKAFTEPDPSYKPLVIYGENIVEITHKNSFGLGNNVELELSSNTPAKAMFWVAENIDATKLNNRSNYTTDPNNIMNGWGPISDISLSYGSVVKIKSMYSNHFNTGIKPREFMSPPSEPGYHALSFGYDVNSLHADVGIVFNRIGKVKISANLEDTNPFLKRIVDKRRKNDDQDPDTFIPDELQENIRSKKRTRNGSNFKLKVYLLTTTRITLPSTGKIELDRGVVPGNKDLFYE